MPALLVVDDEPPIQRILRRNLNMSGYDVLIAEDGKEAVEMVRMHQPDLILLDLWLPGEIDGLGVCRRVRQWTQTPIIVLSARKEEKQKVEALDLGADDYLTKPFSPRELIARISAILRRSGWQSDDNNGLRPPKIKSGDLELDLASRIVSKSGKALNLTTAEFDLLHMFFEAPGQVLTRDKLVEHVLGRKFSPFDRSIDFHITNLRRKLGAQPDGSERIRSIRGTGYLYAWPKER